ncbi:hypothetical protein PCL_06231 [Purpureocillium lilacinum]|nr:hypothetical protein PCL_06231 [Purpureocillium lilacinum]
MCMHTHTLPLALLPSPTPVDHGLRAPDAQPAPRTRGRDATMMQGCDRIASRFHPVTRPWGRDADRNQVAARGCGSQRANNGGRSSGGIEISTCSPAEVSGGGGGGCHWAVEGRTPDERRACWLAGRLGGKGIWILAVVDGRAGNVPGDGGAGAGDWRKGGSGRAVLLQGMATRSTARRTRKLRAWKPPLVLRNNARGRSSNMTVASTACCAFPCSVHSVPRCNAPRHVLLPRASAITHTHTQRHTLARMVFGCVTEPGQPITPIPQPARPAQPGHPSIRPSIRLSKLGSQSRTTDALACAVRQVAYSLPPPFISVTRLPERPTASSSTSPGGARPRQRQPLLNLPDPVDTRCTEGRPRCSGRLLAPSAELAVRCAAAALATRGAALEHGHDLTARHACSFPASPARPLSPLVPVASHVPFVRFRTKYEAAAWEAFRVATPHRTARLAHGIVAATPLRVLVLLRHRRHQAAQWDPSPSPSPLPAWLPCCPGRAIQAHSSPAA